MQGYVDESASRRVECAGVIIDAGRARAGGPSATGGHVTELAAHVAATPTWPARRAVSVSSRG
jgi:hypothetical protein